MTKTISFDDEELILEKASYAYDDSLAVVAKTIDGESYAVLTVNLDFPALGNNEQFFDINLYKGLELLDLLIAEGVLEKTGFEQQSGFVKYPLVRWNL